MENESQLPTYRSPTYLYVNPALGEMGPKAIGDPIAGEMIDGGRSVAGLRVAVKDIIDVKGMPTSAGTRAVLMREVIAERDAACLEPMKEMIDGGEIVIVGKTNTHELALGVTGINPWFGTPVNPINPLWVPGGSSSGSAVAVANGEVDFALGSDTGGSIRIPAACCGVVGLKTTFGRVPTEGTVALAPSLDTIGPMARDAETVGSAMCLLAGDFRAELAVAGPARSIGFVDLGAPGNINANVRRALAASGANITEIALPMWDEATMACGLILVAEAAAQHGYLVTEQPELIGEDVKMRLALGSQVSPDDMRTHEKTRLKWISMLGEAFGKVDVLAMPTLSAYPPMLDEVDLMFAIRNTMPVNLAGVPAISFPATIPADGSSVQLVGPMRSEAMLVATAAAIGAALA